MRKLHHSTPTATKHNIRKYYILSFCYLKGRCCSSPAQKLGSEEGKRINQATRVIYLINLTEEVILSHVKGLKLLR